MSDGFGFGDITPRTAARVEAETDRQLDRIADVHGFVSRQATLTIQRKVKPGPDGPVGQFNLRAAVADVNDFVEWCGRERMSYREGFGKLMDLWRRSRPS